MFGDFDDNIVDLDTGFKSGAIGVDAGDDNTSADGELERICTGLGEGFDAHADFSPSDLAVLGKLRCDPVDSSAGDSEPDSLEATAGGHDGGVDPDQFAVEIDQCASGVARIDRGICLQELAFDESIERAAFGTDDADADRLFEGEGAADGDDPITDLKSIGAAERNTWQRRIGLDPKDGDITAGVADRIDTWEFATVRQSNPDRLRILDDMVIGNAESVRFEDHSGTDVEVFGGVAVEQVEFVQGRIDIGSFCEDGYDGGHRFVRSVLKSDSQRFRLILGEQSELVIVGLKGGTSPHER